MKILITGDAGFISNNLCKYFANKNYEVTCLDNSSTGFIQNLLDKENFKFIKN